MARTPPKVPWLIKQPTRSGRSMITRDRADSPNSGARHLVEQEQEDQRASFKTRARCWAYDVRQKGIARVGKMIHLIK